MLKKKRGGSLHCKKRKKSLVFRCVSVRLGFKYPSFHKIILKFNSYRSRTASYLVKQLQSHKKDIHKIKLSKQSFVNAKQEHLPHILNTPRNTADIYYRTCTNGATSTKRSRYNHSKQKQNNIKVTQRISAMQHFSKRETKKSKYRQCQLQNHTI